MSVRSGNNKDKKVALNKEYLINIWNCFNLNQTKFELLIISRLCSIQIIEFPNSISLSNEINSFLISSKWCPVVGSSNKKIVLSRKRYIILKTSYL